MYILDLEKAIAKSPIIRTSNLFIESEKDTLKISGELTLVDGSFIAFFEYHRYGKLDKYRIHWQDAAGKTIARWDNASHHPELQGFPYHKHVGTKVQPSRAVNLIKILKEIEQSLL